MKYISTRNNHPPVECAQAINLGMVPAGGLFVPRDVPRIDIASLAGGSYQDTALRVLTPLMTGYTGEELLTCIEHAYNPDTFDTEGVIELAQLDERRSVMELWHGPTAAFKDVALQIMPHFLAAAKRKVGETRHTVILVATSGDTGTAALQGFRDCEGISIIVFYPEAGVSEIQKLQMITAEGSNTHVVAVKGNFDDCQNGVKGLFSDNALAEDLAKTGFTLSSANSINWGRLCPQIVYYIRAYLLLVEQGKLEMGAPVDFCVPTGNFGNILAAYYAMRMGAPIGRLLCASNRNKILTDFFETGVYDKNREFFRTMSPAMDILISSNLERFLYEVTGHDADRIALWYEDLAARGRFTVDADTKSAMDAILEPGWVDEPRVLDAIGRTYRSCAYAVDTHTAVAVAMSENASPASGHMVIDSTASPYKFSRRVVEAISGGGIRDEFRSVDKLHELTGMPVHRAVRDLRHKPVRHTRSISTGAMRDAVLDILARIE
ncbi:MAG: threonine synthase [Chitinivibrionales bacterium]|nr:threonine synthase [Chitinivibrionales bacterium]MBD3395907.1 threonine synthase [Chitinivibrionales bacterium]